MVSRAKTAKLKMSNQLCPICDNNNVRIIAKANQFEVIKCNSCGVFFLHPLPTKEELQLYFSNTYIKNLRTRGHASDNGEPSNQYVEFMSPLIEQKKRLIKTYSHGSKILHIGCSFGLELFSLKQERWDVFGCEPGVEFSRYAREILGMPIKTTSFEECYNEYEDGFFDVIIVSHVLHVISDPRNLLNKAKQKLKDSGIIYIEVPNHLQSYQVKMVSVLRKAKGWEPVNPFGMPFTYYYATRTLRVMLEKLGFDILLLHTSNRHHEKVGLFINSLLEPYLAHTSRSPYIRPIQLCMKWITRNKISQFAFQLFDKIIPLCGTGMCIFAIGRKSTYFVTSPEVKK